MSSFSGWPRSDVRRRRRVVLALTCPQDADHAPSLPPLPAPAPEIQTSTPAPVIAEIPAPRPIAAPALPPAIPIPQPTIKAPRPIPPVPVVRQRPAPSPATPPQPVESLLLRKIRRARELTWVFSGDSLLPPEEATAKSGTLASILAGQVHRQFKETKFTFANTTSPATPLWRLFHDYERRIGGLNMDVLLLTCGPAEVSTLLDDREEFEQMCRWIISRARNQGAMVILNLPPYIKAPPRGHSVDCHIRLAALRGCAVEAGAIVIDHWSYWEARAKEDWYRDSLPSRKGFEQMTRLILNELGLPIPRRPAAAQPVRAH